MRRAAARTAAVVVVTSLAASGCGEDDGRRSGDPPTPQPPAAQTRPAPAPARSPALVATLGDSITAGLPYWDPDPELRKNIGKARDRRSQYQYWARRKLGRHVRFRNCGVPGERTDEIAKRLDRCAHDAHVLVVQGGLNDIAQGRPPAAAARDLRSIVARAKRKGLRVAIAELLPWNNGYPRFAPAIAGLNRRIRAFARAERVRVLPWYRALEDPAKPGRMRDDLTAEGDHPSIAGYRRLGESVTLPSG